MRGGGGGKLGGIGPGDEVFCSMRFLALIDHGGRRRPTSSCQKAGVQDITQSILVARTPAK